MILAYQIMRLTQSMRENLDFETFTKQLDEITALTPEARLWYIAQFSTSLYSRGKKSEAAKVLDKLDTANVTDLYHRFGAHQRVHATGEAGRCSRKSSPNFRYRRLREAVKLQRIGVPSIAQQRWWQYHNIYNSLATAYIREGEIGRGSRNTVGIL